MSVKAAIQELHTADSDEDISYESWLKKHNICRSTLTRQVKGTHASRQDDALKRRLLHLRDEAELIQYIRGLTERHLMPTRQMIINFVTPLAAWEPSESWVTRFLHRNQDTLVTAWTTPMETSRHKADSAARYRQYFGLLHQKIAQYSIEPAHTYNIDKKGFAIRVTGRSKRIFNKLLFSQRQFKQSLHNNNCE